MTTSPVRCSLTVLALVSMLSASAPAPVRASAAEAQACATLLATAGALGDYRVRESDTDTLAQGYRADYTLTLYRGNDYAIFACGDSRVSDLDIYLYDENGNRVAHDTLRDAQPVVEMTPLWTGAFKARVVMHDAAGGQPPYYTFVVLYRPR